MHHMHLPARRDIVMKMDHLAHNERFWTMVAFVALFTALILLAVFADLKNPQVPDIMPMPPFILY